MKYQATVQEKTFELEIDRIDETTLSVQIGDRKQTIAVAQHGDPNSFTLGIGVGTIDVHVAGEQPLKVFIDNTALAVEVLDERQILHLDASGHAASSGHQTMTTPMPGKVVHLLKQVGDTVSAGEGVIVVEAMKMENELKAAVDGVVTEILVGPGDTVDGGAVLVQIAPPPEE